MRPGPRVLARPPRDVRLDILRGWMQVSIFVSHVVGTSLAWGIHAAWGVSDSSEQFLFLSGLALGSVHTLKAARDGPAAAGADMRRRTGRLYLTQASVVALFAALVFAADLSLLPGEVARTGWAWATEAPLLALPALAAMVYQPAFTGILPVFVVCMLALPAFAWAADRVGAWALAPAVALWAAVQAGWVATPSLGGGGIAFDPLAWQLIFFIGAYHGRRALREGRAVPRHPALLLVAGSVLVLGLWARLIGHGFIVGPETAAMALLDKEYLAAPRLVHALALAYLAAVLLPRDAGWMRGAVGGALAAVGRHSLHVFCVGLFLAWGASSALRLYPGAAMWLDPVLVIGGALLLVGFAQHAERQRGVAQPRATG